MTAECRDMSEVLRVQLNRIKIGLASVLCVIRSELALRGQTPKTISQADYSAYSRQKPSLDSIRYQKDYIFFMNLGKVLSYSRSILQSSYYQMVIMDNAQRHADSSSQRNEQHQCGINGELSSIV